MSGDKLVESFKVATTLSAQRIVYPSAANTVAYLNTVTSLPCGVTIDTVDDTTQAIPVQLDGRAYILFNDTVAAGGLVTADSNGRGVPFSAVTAATAYVGQLIGNAVAATGTIAEVLINPGYQNIP
jgi:hypothetical protein